MRSWVGVVLFLSNVLSFAWSAGVGLYATKVHGVPVKVVVANLNDSGVGVSVVTTRRLGRAESVWRLLARARPTAAVCGTYFSKRDKIPIGDIVIDGELVHFGGFGTSLCITYDNRVEFVRAPRWRHHDWRAYECVLGAGPRLLLNGQVWVQPRAEGFRDPRVYAATSRTAVGVTKHNKLLLVVTRHPVTLRQLARLMKALGAVNAIALDGGASTCLYYRKRLLLKPGRPLTNLLVLYEDRQVYEQVKAYLGPTNRYVRR